MTEVAAAMCIGVGALIGLTITSRFSLRLVSSIINFCSCICEEVPWYLDDGTAQVKVLNYQRAYRFDDLLQGYRSYAPVPKLYEELASNKQIVFPADKKRCECWEQVLYVGTKLTIVGRAGIDQDGTPTIDEAYQFYSERIQPKAKIFDLEQHSKFCENLAVLVLTVMGIIILAKAFLPNT